MMFLVYSCLTYLYDPTWLSVRLLQHVMRFSEATQEVQVHRAQDKPKFAEQQLAHRSRRRPAAVSTHESQPPSKKMNSLGRMPSAPVPLSEIYSLPPFPELPVC